jgi:hypothetical protein
MLARRRGLGIPSGPDFILTFLCCGYMPGYWKRPTKQQVPAHMQRHTASLQAHTPQPHNMHVPLAAS